jgi:hypothetical protein
MSDWTRMSNPEGAFSLGAYEWRNPSYNRRAEPPARCYNCGAEIDDVTVSLYGSYCSGSCAVARGPVDPWLVNGGER